jgi:uncharacterized integral membrane protein
MRLPLSILIGIAVIVAVIFAVPNREVVTIKFWPFETEVAAPLYLLAFASVFFGFATGWLAAWISQSRWRRRVREQDRRIEHLEKEVMVLSDSAAKPAEPEKKALLPTSRWRLPGS